MSSRHHLEQLTKRNEHYRRVLQTTPQMQLVLMHLDPQETIPREVHPHTTQFIRVEGGSGLAKVGKRTIALSDGRFVMIPPNTEHEIIAGPHGMDLYTLYSPPEHPPHTKQWSPPHD